MFFICRYVYKTFEYFSFKFPKRKTALLDPVKEKGWKLFLQANLHEYFRLGWTRITWCSLTKFSMVTSGFKIEGWSWLRWVVSYVLSGCTDLSRGEWCGAGDVFRFNLHALEACVRASIRVELHDSGCARSPCRGWRRCRWWRAFEKKTRGNSRDWEDEYGASYAVEFDVVFGLPTKDTI